VIVKKTLSTASPEKTIAWLEKILSTQKAFGFSIMAVWGINVNKPVPLGSDVSLLPIEMLPESYQKKHLLDIDWHRHFMDSMPRTAFFETPKAALICRTLIEPLTYYHKNADKLPRNQEFSGRELLNEVQLVLTIIGPCVPIHACSWFQFVDTDIEDAKFGYNTSYQHLEIMPMRIAPLGDFDYKCASSIVSKYLAIEGTLKKRIRLALERLNQGLRRTNAGDRAMEIAIALEVLLADGGTENTFKVGLRSALLIGGDIKTRLENRAIVGGAYTMRSALVHSGVVSKETNLVRIGKMPSEEVAKRAAILCAHVIKIIILRGHLPDWYEFELSTVAEIT
jgi:hypothetical protein